MRLSTLLLTIGVALLDLASCLPAAEGSQLDARTAPAGIQMWSGADFTGHFVHYTGAGINYDTCYDITAEFPPHSSGSLLSVKADHLNWCSLFPNTVCDPGSGNDNDRLWVIGSYYDLSNPEEGWGGRAMAFSCTYCPNCGN